MAGEPDTADRSAEGGLLFLCLAEQTLLSVEPTAFPGCLYFIRLVGAVLVKQHDDWTEGWRYVSPELLTKSRIRIVTTELSTPPTKPAMTTVLRTTLSIHRIT